MLVPWDRTLRTSETAQEARYDCLVWLPEPLTSLKFDRIEDGFPGGSSNGDLGPFFIQDVPADLLRQIEVEFADLALANHLLDPSRLPQNTHALLVSARLTDPEDLSHLQTASAICRGLARMGAAAFFDVVSQRFWDWDEILALRPDRAFAIREHITLQLRPDEPPLSGSVCQTRGLVKVARPDLLLRSFTHSQTPAVCELLNEIASRLAAGSNFTDSSVLELQHPSGMLPPLTFRYYPNDTMDEHPLHGLGQNAFANSAFEVVDFLPEEQAASAGCERLLQKLTNRQQT